MFWSLRKKDAVRRVLVLHRRRAYGLGWGRDGGGQGTGHINCVSLTRQSVCIILRIVLRIVFGCLGGCRDGYAHE